ncbi:universal stress protein [Actinoplanes sp. CA-252034]|uniref:universal stress protein n=1 Tax=Actinoplanes sp. CA-252034 TaxID=3239906 RepID=UPI003D953F9F
MNTSASARVVAGVSGSPAGRRAVEAAAREAERRNCPLHLAHTFNLLSDDAEDPRAAREVLSRAAVVAASVAPDIRITTELVEGHPLPSLLRLSRRAVLTVIGDGDLNDLTFMPREATAVQLAARAFGSVLVTRAAPVPPGPVVAGLDDSLSAEAVLHYAFNAAAHRGSGLIVVHVSEAGSRTGDLDEVVASRARKYGVDARLRVLTGDPTAVMVRQSEQASLIVVGARGRFPYRGLLGSVAQTMLHHGHAPVAIVRGTSPVLCRPSRTIPGPAERTRDKRVVSELLQPAAKAVRSLPS